MRPVLFSIFGLDVQTYGVSKVLAALLAAVLLARAFERLGLKKDDAYALVFWATVWGFVGAKIYFLLENLPNLTWHHLGGAGFTWYGGFLAGLAAALVMIRRRHLPIATVVDAAAIPLTLAYAVGRVGCWFSGDGTYGRPTTLPWGMTVSDGMVPTDVPVHPTPLYEALAAVLIAAALWALSRRRPAPLTIVAGYLILSGMARFAVELLRINDPVLLGMTQPQLWSMVSIAAGAAVIMRPRLRLDGTAGSPSSSIPALDRSAVPRTLSSQAKR